MSQLSLVQRLNDFFDKKEHFLDSFIDSGSEQDLFVTSYIHGHFSVEAAKVMASASQCKAIDMSVENTAKQFEQTFTSLLNASISNAISNKELEAQDAKEVQNMLERMFEQK